jgi:hypothetical protein
MVVHLAVFLQISPDGFNFFQFPRIKPEAFAGFAHIHCRQRFRIYNQARKKLDIVDKYDMLSKDNIFLKSEGIW